jgi:uncharacterized membrane protein YphA (DoxX/SURF4 family)
VSLIIRFLIGGLFIASGVLKLLDPAAFAWNIYQYGLVPRPLINPLAVGLPAVEIVAGAGLVMNSRWSFGAVAGMLVLFMALLAYALISGLQVDCGCFGPGEPGPAGLRSALLRDAVMLGALVLAWLLRDERSVQGRTDVGSTISTKEDAL